MRFQDAVGFRGALEVRLESLSDGDEELLARDRRCIAFGRILARLAATAPKRWSLSGGFAIDCRTLRSRPTDVLDVEWKAKESDGFMGALEEATQHDAGDLFDFETEFAGAIIDPFGASKRFRVRALIGKEVFESFLLNVRMRFAYIGSQPIRAEDHLAFAGVAPVDVEAVPAAVLIAECLHRHTNAVEEEQGPPAAVDLLDIGLLAELPDIRGTSLAMCIFGVFKTHEEEMPVCLLDPHEYWAEWYGNAADSMGFPGDLEDGYDNAAAFLDPILQGTVFKATWNPTAKTWQ